ncbi:tRNA pseudouridine(38-40) synthase [Sporothrix schenckii ATCC 58251]|uniref:tRNA pseudouridine(38-40) synthase n=2 Tax=Sporothrix schenckii TaxID=29908 RepID=U7PN02_SPOS1|nr:tRNA pseudouridine(38-40) synthase [Sporothrix schenckii ATCC 58251]
MTDYTRWTKEALVQRIQELEEQAVLTKQNGLSGGPTISQLAPSTTPKPKKAIDPSRYGTRYIALRIAYLGKRYGGFEYQPSGALPSVEEELWKALVKACLIFPEPGAAAHEVDFNICEYSKCGRTDRGVSAFGQVVALRVRSNRKRTAKVVDRGDEDGEQVDDEEGGRGRGPGGSGEAGTSTETEAITVDGEESNLPLPHEEIQYGKVLNRLLPPDIRVLAWCPNPPPDFSARFSCRERRYRYFFTQPAYFGSSQPLSSAEGGPSDGWLDIDAMRTAAKHFVGLHDFRNFCKIDPNKQITNFARRIFDADIVEVPGLHASLDYYGGSSSIKVYSFDVRGSAFLWHQIRHMVAILFLVGQGRESADVIPQLLDASANPGRPAYAMAEEGPLVLWDCIFPPAVPADAPEAAIDHPDAGKWTDSLDWFTVAEEAPDSRMMLDGLWRGWHDAKMDEILANQLLNQVTKTPVPGQAQLPTPPAKKSHVYEGGSGPRLGGVYVPLMKRSRLASPEEQNDKFARTKGFASSAAMRDVGNWRTAIREMKEAEATSGTSPASAAEAEERVSAQSEQS